VCEHCGRIIADVIAPLLEEDWKHTKHLLNTPPAFVFSLVLRSTDYLTLSKIYQRAPVLVLLLNWLADAHCKVWYRIAPLG
jgi:hypothetical protein